MRQRALLFRRLEVVETMRAYIAHHMDSSEDLRSKLKLAESELAVDRKVANEGVRLLRKVEEARKLAETEACQLRKEGEAMDAKYNMAEQENEWVK